MKSTIIFVCPYYPPYGSGGAERTSQLHANTVKKLGYDVIVVTPKYGDYEYKGDIPIINFDLKKRLLPGQNIQSRFFYNPLVQKKLKSTLERIALSIDIKCIHVQHQLLLGGAARAAKKLKVPLITHIRDTGLICSLGGSCLMEKELEDIPFIVPNLRHHLWCFFNNWAQHQRLSSLPKRVYGFVKSFVPFFIFIRNIKHLQQSTKIVFASEGLLKIYIKSWKTTKQPEHNVVYAIAKKHKSQDDIKIKIIESFKKDQCPIILYVGKLSKGKGAETLFEAHKQVLKQIPNTKLVICGNIYNEWNYDKENTVFLGFLDQNTLNYLYSTCNLVVLPSTWPEPLGWATIDSARHSKPIVATNVGGIPEAVINNKTGILVNKLDSLNMSIAIIKFIKNKSLSSKVGKEAYKYVLNKFGEKNISKQLNNLYCDL